MQNPMNSALLRTVERDLARVALLARAAQVVRERALHNIAVLEARCATDSSAPAGRRDMGGRTSPRRRKAAQSARGA